MDDSWPASPRAEEISDSISGHAAEVERTLRALEAVEAFRAEAAALRAELHAARPQVARRPAFRPVAGPELSPSTWRLMIEAGFLVGVAVVAWAIHLKRLEIVLVMAGAWMLVALLEALAWRRTETSYPLPLPSPAAPAPEPAYEPMPVVAEAPELTTVLPQPEPVPEPVPVPEPEPEPEPEPALEAEAESPLVDAPPPEEPDAATNGDLPGDLSPRRLRLPRFRRGGDKTAA
jgi:hypothetical protein